MSQFPKNKLSKTSLHTGLEWKSEEVLISYEMSWNGHVYLFRDKRVPVKVLSSEETRELMEQECKSREKAGNASATGSEDDPMLPSGSGSTNGANSTKMRRKEKALKIYFDCSPVKN